MTNWVQLYPDKNKRGTTRARRDLNYKLGAPTGFELHLGAIGNRKC